MASFNLYGAVCKRVPSECDVRIELLRNEKRFALILPGVTSITFMQADDPDKMEHFLRKRVAEIVIANPWLTGFIGYNGSKMSLCYNSKPRKSKTRLAPESYLHVCEDDDLHAGMSYQQVCKRTKGCAVGCVNIGDPTDQLFRVTLVKTRDSKKMALLCSISHVLGDGATFYTVYKMLSQAHLVSSMDPFREREFDEKEIGTGMVPQESHKYWSQSIRPFMGTVLRGFLNKVKMLFTEDTPFQTAEAGIFKVNIAAVAQIKAEHKRRSLQQGPQEHKPTFLSTNDVLTSWFLNHVNNSAPETDAGLLAQDQTPIQNGASGMMAVDFRGKSPEIDRNLAGNYIGTAVFIDGADISPTGVRQAISSMGAVDCENPGQFPGLMYNIRDPWTIVTNWAAFYTELDLPGLDSIQLHYPMLTVSNRHDWGSINMCIVFNAGADNGMAVHAVRSILSGSKGTMKRDLSRAGKDKKSIVGDIIIPVQTPTMLHYEPMPEPLHYKSH